MDSRPVLSISSLALTLLASLPLTTSQPTYSSRPHFKLHVHNACPFPKSIGIYSVTPTFEMLQHGPIVNLSSNTHHTLHAPYHGTGMRLSGHAEWGLNGQWQPQLLFEFGYSAYDTVQGTAYDISMMEGSDDNVGMKVRVLPNGAGSETCETKLCLPGDCAPNQGWTSPGQAELGSPADAVCYHGKADFRVTYCPEKEDQ